MTGLEHATTADLLNELARRRAIRCKCRRWKVYVHYSGGIGCHGCRRLIEECTCG